MTIVDSEFRDFPNLELHGFIEKKKILTYVTRINKGLNFYYTLTCFKCAFVIKFARRLISRDRCQVTVKNSFMSLSDLTLSI